jgi:prevent-host-death family protein
MKKLTISQDIVPVAEFKTSISKYLKSLKETGHPVIITQNGRPAGVVITPIEYDNLTYKSLFIESVNKGLNDIESGEFYTTEELKEKIKSARVSRNKQ